MMDIINLSHLPFMNRSQQPDFLKHSHPANLGYRPILSRSFSLQWQTRSRLQGRVWLSAHKIKVLFYYRRRYEKKDFFGSSKEFHVGIFFPLHRTNISKQTFTLISLSLFVFHPRVDAKKLFLHNLTIFLDKLECNLPSIEPNICAQGPRPAVRMAYWKVLHPGRLLPSWNC
jgi:hypothetical protein